MCVYVCAHVCACRCVSTHQKAHEKGITHTGEVAGIVKDPLETKRLMDEDSLYSLFVSSTNGIR